MNGSIIRYILGQILKLEGIFMLVPTITGAIYGEKEALIYLGVGAFCSLFGFMIARKKPSNDVFYLKEGCVATALSWINASYNHFFLANVSLPVIAPRSNLSTFQYFYLYIYF